MVVCRMFVCLSLYLKSLKHIVRFKQNTSHMVCILPFFLNYSSILWHLKSSRTNLECGDRPFMGTRGSFKGSGVINVAVTIMSLLGCPDFISLIMCHSERRGKKASERVSKCERERERLCCRPGALGCQ